MDMILQTSKSLSYFFFDIFDFLDVFKFLKSLFQKPET